MRHSVVRRYCTGCRYGHATDDLGLQGLRERSVACPQWHCRAWLRARSNLVLAARTWPAVRGSAWNAPRPALTATADLPVGLPDRDRPLRGHVAGNDRFTVVGQRIKRAGQANRHHPAALRPADSLPSCRFMVDDLAEADRPSTPQLTRNLPYRTYDLICCSVFKSTIKTDFIHVASETWIAAATKAQRYQTVIFLKARLSGKSP